MYVFKDYLNNINFSKIVILSSINEFIILMSYCYFFIYQLALSIIVSQTLNI